MVPTIGPSRPTKKMYIFCRPIFQKLNYPGVIFSRIFFNEGSAG